MHTYYQRMRSRTSKNPIPKIRKCRYLLFDDIKYLFSCRNTFIDSFQSRYSGGYIFLCASGDRSESLHVEPLMPIESSPLWRETVAMQVELAARLYGCDVALVDLRRLSQKLRPGQARRELDYLSGICGRFGIPLMPIGLFNHLPGTRPAERPQ